MTQPIFRRIEDEQGEVRYEEVPVTEVLSEDVVKETDAYKALLTESIERRKQLADLKKNQQPPAQEPAQDDTPEPVQPESTPTFDPDELFARFEQRLLERQQQEQQAAEQRQQTLKEVGKKFNVNPTLLRGNTLEELEQHAQVLSKEFLQFQDIGSNPTPDAVPDIENLLKGVDKRFGWED